MLISSYQKCGLVGILRLVIRLNQFLATKAESNFSGPGIGFGEIHFVKSCSCLHRRNGSLTLGSDVQEGFSSLFS